LTTTDLLSLSYEVAGGLSSVIVPTPTEVPDLRRPTRRRQEQRTSST